MKRSNPSIGDEDSDENCIYLLKLEVNPQDYTQIFQSALNAKANQRKTI